MSDSSVSPIECLDCCIDCEQKSDTNNSKQCKQPQKPQNLDSSSSVLINGNSSIRRQMLAAAIGSAAATIALSPMSVVKINLQRGSSSSSVSNGHQTASISTTFSHQQQHPSLTIGAAISEVYKKNGIGGFWAGSRLGLVQSLPNTVLYMTVYEYLKIRLGDKHQPNASGSSSSCNSSGSSSHSLIPGVAGGLARVVAVTAMAPLELVRTIQQASNQRGVVEIAENIFHRDGVRGFYRGLTSTVARDAPFSAIYWCTFELLRNAQIDTSSSRGSGGSIAGSGMAPSRESSSNARNFVSGASAGVVAALLTHPFDVLKTQTQLRAESLASRAPLSVLDIIRNGAAFRGLSVRLATVIPASAIMVTIYEFIKSYDYK